MSKHAPNDTSLQTTKQMLDELDALMEKMLALPVNDSEDAPAFPKDVVRPPAGTATLTFQDLQSRASPPTLDPPAHPVLNAPHFTMNSTSETVQPSPHLEPLTNAVAPPSRAAELEHLLAGVPEDATPTVTPWGYWPLVWINTAFDALTWVLGAPGAGLRSDVGRFLLGVSGVAMMVFAAVWFLKDWLGWNW